MTRIRRIHHCLCEAPPHSRHSGHSAVRLSVAARGTAIVPEIRGNPILQTMHRSISRGPSLLAALLALLAPLVQALPAQETETVEPWRLIQPPQSSLVVA